MKVLITFLTLLTWVEATEVSMDAAHSEGIKQVQEDLNKVLGNAASPDLSNLPNYKGPHEDTTSGLDVHNIKDSQLTYTSPATDFIKKSYKERSHFKIDVEKDPLLVSGDKALENPEKLIAEEENENLSESSTTFETKTTLDCEESEEDVIQECIETQNVTIAEPPLVTHQSSIVIYSHGWRGGVGRNILTNAKLDSTGPTRDYAASTILQNQLPLYLQPRIRALNLATGTSGYVSLSQDGSLWVTTGHGGGWMWHNFTAYINITYQRLPNDSDVQTSISSQCGSFEEKVDAGLCIYEDEVILEGPQTRIIDGLPVTLDWWKRKRIFRCHYPSKNDCGPLRAKGCAQIHSKCKVMVGEHCAVWQQTYQCPQTIKRYGRPKISGKGIPYCLDGNCTDHGYAANDEMANALSKLAIFKEMQNQYDKDTLQVFTGGAERCSRSPISFKNCCGKGKGWGLSLKFAKCSPDEKKLAILRDENRCVLIGTYCAKKQKGTGICLKKQTTFCCFPSKFARIIHEQGRRQLNLGWGDPKDSPQCQGLTIEQLGALDFSQMDLSELFEEILKGKKEPSGCQVGKGIQSRIDSLSNMVPKDISTDLIQGEDISNADTGATVEDRMGIISETLKKSSHREANFAR